MTSLDVTVVEDMHLIDDRGLLVQLRVDNDTLTNGAIVMLDRDTGQRLWSYPRQDKPGNFQMIYRLDNSLLFQVSDQQSTRLMALDLNSGRHSFFAEIERLETGQRRPE